MRTISKRYHRFEKAQTLEGEKYLYEHCPCGVIRRTNVESKDRTYQQANGSWTRKDPKPEGCDRHITLKDMRTALERELPEAIKNRKPLSPIKLLDEQDKKKAEELSQAYHWPALDQSPFPPINEFPPIKDLQARSDTHIDLPEAKASALPKKPAQIVMSGDFLGTYRKSPEEITSDNILTECLVALNIAYEEMVKAGMRSRGRFQLGRILYSYGYRAKVEELDREHAYQMGTPRPRVDGRGQHFSRKKDEEDED